MLSVLKDLADSTFEPTVHLQLKQEVLLAVNN